MPFFHHFGDGNPIVGRSSNWERERGLKWSYELTDIPHGPATTNATRSKDADTGKNINVQNLLLKKTMINELASLVVHPGRVKVLWWIAWDLGNIIKKRISGHTHSLHGCLCLVLKTKKCFSAVRYELLYSRSIICSWICVHSSNGEAACACFW